MGEDRGRHITLHRLYTAWAPHLTPRAFKLLIAIGSAIGRGDIKYLKGHALKWSSFDGPALLMEKAGIETERSLRKALAELKQHDLIVAYSRGRQNGHILNPYATPVQSDTPAHTDHDPCPNGPPTPVQTDTQKLSSLEAIEMKLCLGSAAKTKTPGKTLEDVYDKDAL